jgi:ATP-dependent DNA helicase RecQ
MERPIKEFEIMDPLKILQQRFGYASFRLHQEAIIQSVLQKRDTFVLMPTGGGKSICYQIPALIFEGLTIVISPLIALMKDQVDSLRLNGIEAAYLNSTQSSQVQDEILTKAKNGELKLLYLAPERLIGNSAAFLNALTGFKISLIAIDEAHCISHWGHDFRPEYLMLAKLKETLPHVPVVALTATADKLTQKDILEKLDLRDPAIFISSFNRPNIRYSVEPKTKNIDRLLEFINKRKDEAGIIYCLSRKSTEALAYELVRHGFKALPYHAGLERELRSKHQEMFLRDEAKIVVATIAFGMGINKSNVRYVVHMDLPKSIESYYQETGRAGRDGLNSEALLFYAAADLLKLKRFVKIENNEAQTEIVLKKLDQMATFGELVTCRRKYLLNYFNEELPAYCGNCDVCLESVSLVDGTILAQKAISAVVRLGEHFGIGYVVDFLRGSNSEKIRHEHKGLKTFGSGADRSKEQWMKTIQELIERGYLLKTIGKYPVLKLSEKSYAVLKGLEKVMLSTPSPIIISEPIHSEENKVVYETALYSALKTIRKELSLKENVAPYIVVSDATLVELATYLPQNIQELSVISGFGNVKIDKYGSAVLEQIQRYCLLHNLTSRMHYKPAKTLRKPKVEVDSETKRQTLNLYNQGKTIPEIAKLRDYSISSIEAHLAFYVQQRILPIESLLPSEKITAIQQTVDNIGTNRLTPIKEALGDDYTFSDIKFALAHLQNIKVEESQFEYVLVD